MHNPEGQDPHLQKTEGSYPRYFSRLPEPSRYPGLDRQRQFLWLERSEQERPPAFQRDLHSPVPRYIVGLPLSPDSDSPAPILPDRPVGNSLCFDHGGKGEFPPLEMEGEQTKPEVGPGDLDLESHHEEPDREEDSE